MARYNDESSGIGEYVMKLIDRFTLRERSFGQIYAYVNPWSAAMDDAIESARIRSSRAALQKRAKRKPAVGRPRVEGPVARP